MTTQQTLTIHEYDKLYIRQIRNLKKRIISEKDAIYLQQIIINNNPVFTFGNRCLIAQKWVGVVTLPNYSIEILPKIFNEKDSIQARDILIRMLLVAHSSTNVRQIPAALSFKKNSLIEILIETFLIELQNYVNSGLQHDYTRINKNIKKVKGKILFNAHINKNAWNPTYFFCRYSNYQKDVALNQFFKSCLFCMSTLTNDIHNKKKINELLSAFYHISDITREEALNLHIEFTPINIRAKNCFMYGKMFLENIYATIHTGTNKTYSMLFDMNHLFETFIYRSLLFIYGNRVAYQKKAGYVISRIADSKRFISMRPDLSIKHDNNTEYIIDTKWKIPNKFAKESDIYQMNAYSTSNRNVKKVILLYPYLESTAKIVGKYTFLLDDKKNRILEIKAIDLTKILSWNEFLRDLQNLVSLPQSNV